MAAATPNAFLEKARELIAKKEEEAKQEPGQLLQPKEESANAPSKQWCSAFQKQLAGVSGDLSLVKARFCSHAFTVSAGNSCCARVLISGNDGVLVLLATRSCRAQQPLLAGTPRAHSPSVLGKPKHGTQQPERGSNRAVDVRVCRQAWLVGHLQEDRRFRLVPRHCA